MSCTSRTFAAWALVVGLLTFSCGKRHAGSELTEPGGCGPDCDAGQLADAGQLVSGDAGQASRGDGGQSLATGSTAHDGGGTNPGPGDQLFGATEVLNFNFSLDEAKWEELQEHGNAEEYVEAALEFGSDSAGALSFAAIGLRHKGSWSLHHCWDQNGGVRSYVNECAKLSLKVKFDEYDTNGRLDGLKRLNLHALQTDQVKMHELLAYATFREFGVRAPRVLPARVTVNGELLGLFMAVENVDGRFTKAHFANGGDGNLYKETWPHPSFDADEFLSALSTNEESGDVADMLAFAAAIDEATTDDFAEKVGAHLDIDGTLRYLAVDRAINNWDGVAAFYQPEKPHNFYWYYDEGDSNLFHLVPWDLDNTLEGDPFTDPPGEFGVAPLPDWNQKPSNCEPRDMWEPGGVPVTPPRCDKLLDMLAVLYWNEYERVGRELLQGPFTVEALQHKVDTWLPLIEPLIAEDPLLNLDQWQARAAEWRNEILPGLVTEFDAFLDQGLIDEPEGKPPFEAAPPAVSATEDTGFSVSQLNGFEFTDGVQGSQPEGVSYWSDDASTVTPLWNTDNPIDGDADLRIDLTFSRIEGTWNEFIGIGYYGDAGDVRDARYLVVSMAADPPRRVRLALASPVFEEEFGGAWPEFSVEVSVQATPREFGLPLDSFRYVDWARDAWEADQGWTSSDEEAKALVLGNLNGVVFNPLAAVDPSGELVEAEDPGVLQIDRLYFQ